MIRRHAIADAARGALRGQQLLADYRRGKGDPGSLLQHMRQALQTETPVYADAFAREVEKALVAHLVAKGPGNA